MYKCTYGRQATDKMVVNHGKYKATEKTGQMRPQSNGTLLHIECYGVKKMSRGLCIWKSWICISATLCLNKLRPG